MYRNEENQLPFYYNISYTFLSICFSCHLPVSDVNRKAREPRVSICWGRLRAACIDQIVRTFSPVRPIEPDRSENPKYDCEMFVSILNYGRDFFIGSLLELFNSASVHNHFDFFFASLISAKENKGFDRDNANLKKHTIYSNK